MAGALSTDLYWWHTAFKEAARGSKNKRKVEREHRQL
jgi:hypothetical protein